MHQADEENGPPSEPELNTILQHLVDGGQLQGPARGIARQVIARGENTLSQRQEWVFNTQVRAQYVTRACRLCEELIPLPEVMDSWSNGDLCAMCARILGNQADAATT